MGADLVEAVRRLSLPNWAETGLFWTGLVGLVATLGAAGFAGLAYRATSKTLGLERDRKEVEDEERRRRQAVQVSIWWGETKTGERDTNRYLVDGVLSLYVRNGSSEPVFDLYVGHHFPSQIADFYWPWRAVSLEPGRTQRWRVLVCSREPGSGYLADNGLSAWVPTSEGFEVSLIFRDSANRYWQRDRRGVLEAAVPWGNPAERAWLWPGETAPAPPE